MRLKHLYVILFVLSILSIMGCSNHGDTDNEIPPSLNAQIIIDDTEYQMVRGGYEWKIRRGLSTGVVQTDHASPNQMAEHIEPISANPNQKVDIQIEGKPKIKVFLWNEQGKETEIEKHDNQITLSSTEGKYIYEVLAEWRKGTISYTFVVDIK